MCKIVKESTKCQISFGLHIINKYIDIDLRDILWSRTYFGPVR